MQRPSRPIHSLPELRRQVPAILERINSDADLALRAAANPLLALDELGYDLSADLRAEVERRVRFPEPTRVRLQELEKQISATIPAGFDIDKPEELERLLFEELQLPRLPQRVPIKSAARGKAPPAPPAHPRLHPLDPPYAPPGAPKPVDVLEPLRDAHPVIPLLIEYRALQASSSPLASPSDYQRLRSGKVDIPRLRIRARLQSQQEPE